VLVVEDNLINMMLIKTLIGKIAPKAIITEAANGLEALNNCKKSLYDIVLMDIQMPEMNGYESTKAIRMIEAHKETPIIALTAGNVLGEREKCLNAGMNDFVVKPINEQSIVSLFSNWVVKAEHSVTKAIDEIEDNTHFDSNQFYSSFGGDSISIDEYQLIETEMNAMMQYLIEYIDTENLSGINKMGHKLRGSSITCGFNKLSRLANELERLNNFSVNEIDTILSEIKLEMSLVLRMIEPQ
jgi:CheY-like chemotaxis protein